MNNQRSNLLQQLLTQTKINRPRIFKEIPKMNKKPSPETVYVCDFLNIFSDFREIKYKKENIDFHSVKHHNKEQDTVDFFNLFFTKYISYVGVSKTSSFIFVMKKLNEYERILESIIEKHKSFDIKLIIIENQYKDCALDKNKDDFLCQYIFDSIQRTYGNCMMISNDRYRDRESYVDLFVSDMSIKMLQWNSLYNQVQSSVITFAFNKKENKRIVNQSYKRCSIPKHRLTRIIS